MKNYLQMFLQGGRSFVLAAESDYDPRFDQYYIVNPFNYSVGNYVRPVINAPTNSSESTEDEYYDGFNGTRTDYTSGTTRTPDTTGTVTAGSTTTFSTSSNSLRSVSGTGGGKTNDKKYTNAQYIIQKLKEYGMPENAAIALAIHAGAESRYKLDALNNRSSAWGLGQWINASQRRLLQLWNTAYNLNRTTMKDFTADDLIKALKLWYWDNGIAKRGANGNDSVYNLVSEFAQYGFAPAYYGNVDRIILYARETGHDVDDWDKHIRTRITNAGFLLS